MRIKNLLLLLIFVSVIMVLAINVKAVCQSHCLSPPGCVWIGCVYDNCYNVCVPDGSGGCQVTQLVDCNVRHTYCSTSNPPCGGGCMSGWHNCNNDWSDGCERAVCCLQGEYCNPSQPCCSSLTCGPNGQCVATPPTKYSCNTQTHQCYQDVNGQYTSLSSCQAACQEPQEPNCVRIAGVNYCCGAPDNVCPEHFETPQGTTIDCGAIGQPDNDCVGGIVECNSCADCSTKLLPGYTVKLTQDILMEDADYNCISSMNGHDFIFDCQGHRIYRTSQPTKHPIGIFMLYGKNITIKNCNIFNLSSGVGIHFSNTTLVINTTSCSNRVNDFTNQSSGQGTTGYNNTCSVPYNWKDFGMMGCTYQCYGAPTNCNITGASIKPYCGSDGCSAGESIAMNITVENMTKCDALIVNNIEMFATTAGGADGCDVNMVNTTQIYRDTATKTYYANWSVSVPSGCSGRTVYAKVANLYNATGIIATKTATIPPGFGNFTFAGGVPQQYNLSVDTCGDNNVPPDGSCDNYSVKGNVTVNQELWGLAPQSRLKASGLYTITFGQLQGWYKPNDTLVSLIQNVSVMGVYTKVPLTYAVLTIKATNKTGHNIGAGIYLYNNTNMALLKSGTDTITYTYTGSYPAEFKVNFSDISGYIKPQEQFIIIQGNGAYSYQYYYDKQPVGVQCQITTANITAFCGSDGICSEGEKIRLNITVASMANCTSFNINKIAIDASDSGQGGQGSQGGGGMTGFAVQSVPSQCIVYMTNSTPITVLGNSYIGNWTVSVSLNCQGKTVTTTKAKIYNGTNNLVHSLSGNFGGFTFAGQVGGCYCVYNNQQYSCGTCVTGAFYDCKDVGGQGQLISNCTKCNNCPSGTTCQNAICIPEGQQQTACHQQTNVTNCHNDTRTNAFCFWDRPRQLAGFYCEACYIVNGIPKTCFDYKNESACVFGIEGDKCNIGPLCLNANGLPIPGATNCKCSWSGTNCTLNYIIDGGGGQHCNLNMVYSECDEGTCGAGKRDVIYDYSNQTGYTDCDATDSTSCQDCGIVFRPLPFFEWWNVIIVAAAIALIYAFIISKESFRKRFYQKK